MLLCKISTLVSLLSSLEKEVCLCGVKLPVIIDHTYMITFMRPNVLQIYVLRVP